VLDGGTLTEGHLRGGGPVFLEGYFADFGFVYDGPDVLIPGGMITWRDGGKKVELGRAYSGFTTLEFNHTYEPPEGGLDDVHCP
jgi:hypothetical protein